VTLVTQEKLKKLLDETRPLQLAFVKDKAGKVMIREISKGTVAMITNLLLYRFI